MADESKPKYGRDLIPKGHLASPTLGAGQDRPAQAVAPLTQFKTNGAQGGDQLGHAPPTSPITQERRPVEPPEQKTDGKK